MSMTLLALVGVALRALGEYAQQNPGIAHAAIKSAQPVIREAAKQIDDVVTGDDYRKAGWTVVEEGEMFRIYHLLCNKSADGLAQAVYDFFRTYTGTKVSLGSKEGVDGTVITCIPESISGSSEVGTKAGGLVRKATGTDIKLTVVVSAHGNDVAVTYLQEIDDELIRATKALLGNPVLGVCKLYGINERHQIPFELHSTITKYLETEHEDAEQNLYSIDDGDCICCGSCAAVCPIDAIQMGDSSYIIDTSLCVNCGACVDFCPVDAIRHD